MDKNLQASSFYEIAHQGDLIPIFPKGMTKGYDGRGPYFLKDANKVIAASRRDPVDLVIDRDHAADIAPPGTPNKAAGWIKELVEVDGAIMARAEWTPAASQELEDKEYRYISPTFTYAKDGTVLRILRATLTNIPNFNMKAVASAQFDTENPTEEENDTMDKLLIALAAALGLTGTATEEIVLAKIKENAGTLETSQTALAAAQTTLATVAKSVGLDEKAKSEEIVATAASLKATGKEVDATQYVPISQFKETQFALAAMQSEREEEKATAAVEEAMKAGKVTPKQKDWAMSYAKKGLIEFKAYAASAPVVVQPGETKTAEKIDPDKVALDPEDKAICSQLGIPEGDYKKALAA